MTLLNTVNKITQEADKLLQKISFIILTIMPFFLAWVAVGQLIQSHLTIDKLTKVTGVIAGTKEVTTQVSKGIFYTHKDIELRIYLKDNSDYFRFMNIYHYNLFRNKIRQGSIAQIYVRPKWLVPLGQGYRNDIFQMTVNGQTIFNVSQTYRNADGMTIVSILSIPLFVYFRRRAKRKMREKEKLQAT